jgi:hypothetical protein
LDVRAFENRSLVDRKKLGEFFEQIRLMLKRARRLYETACKIKWAALRKQHPDWFEEQVLAGVRRIFTTGYLGEEY